LTCESGILKELLPGDVLLADQGFYIAEEVGLMQESLEIPAFTKGLYQPFPIDVEKKQQCLQIHVQVEWVNGATRQHFFIYSSVLPIQYMKRINYNDVPVVDKVVQVSCTCCSLY